MPPDTKKSRALVSNPKAMRQMLRYMDTNLGLLNTKEQGLKWLEQVSQNNQYPYSGGRNIGPFHNAVTLWDAIGYAVRDNKKEQYKALKGEPATVHLFKLGSAMLEPDYLIRLGYITIDAAGTIQMRNEADAQIYDPPVHVKVEGNGVRETTTKTPRKRKQPSNDQLVTGVNEDDRLIKRPLRHNSIPEPGLSDGRVQHLSSSRHDSSVPQVEVKPTELGDRLEPEEVVYEPVIILPSEKIKVLNPASVPTQTSSPQLTNEHADHEQVLVATTPCKNPTLDHNDFDAELRQDLEQLKEIVAKLAAKVTPEDAHLELAGWQLSDELKTIYVELFDGTEYWRDAFEEVVGGNTIVPSTVVQAMIWAFLNLEVFRLPLPWTSPLTALDHLAFLSDPALVNWTHVWFDLSLRLLKDTSFITGMIQPKAHIKATNLHAILGEHLSILPPITMCQDVCEKAFLLKAKLDASHRIETQHRLFKHEHRAVAYCLPVFDHSKARLQESTRTVAFTIAPGMKQVSSHGKVDVVEPAMIALVGQESDDDKK